MSVEKVIFLGTGRRKSSTARIRITDESLEGTHGVSRQSRSVVYGV